MKSTTVIFICFYNSVRSPIAEGLFRKRCTDNYKLQSAGVAPIHLNPFTLSVMKEIGIDISNHTPTSVFQFQGQMFDYVVTLSDQARTVAGHRLPEGRKTFHRAFDTPPEIGRSHEDVMADFRYLRDSIDNWLSEIFPDIPGGRTDVHTGELFVGQETSDELRSQKKMEPNIQ